MSLSIPLKDPTVSLQTVVSTIRSSQPVYRNSYTKPNVAIAKSDHDKSVARNILSDSRDKVCANCQNWNHMGEGRFLLLGTLDGAKWAAKHPEKTA